MAKRQASESEDEYNDQGSSGSGSDYLHSNSKGAQKPAKGRPPKKKTKRQPEVIVADVECDSPSRALHGVSTHTLQNPSRMRAALLEWYSGVHDMRGMPWRKPYDPSLGKEERAQRAYEVWVSEIMLQQTQVATVIPYYNRWMEKFPTIRDLASSPLDEVNAIWKGLGYYSRASRLLAGAQKAVKEFSGRLPDNAKDMEANIPGIGRYSAGAICSIAYAERVPVLDGNVHRLMSRLLALHAQPKAKATLDVLWAAASVMVQKTIVEESEETPTAPIDHPGDINQALIELGSTVCKVREPSCEICPLNAWCTAYTNRESKLPEDDIQDIEDACTLCKPLPLGSLVTAFPMKVERKKAREELDIVNVIEWRSKSGLEDRQFLLVRRPKGGLLAGLDEFPTLPNVPTSISAGEVSKIPHTLLSGMLCDDIQPYKGSTNSVSKRSRIRSTDVEKTVDLVNTGYRIKDIQPAGEVIHVFSHIKKTYRAQWVLLEGGDAPPELSTRCRLPSTKDRKKSGLRGKKKGGRKKDDYLSSEEDEQESPVVNAVWTPLDKVADAKYVSLVPWNDLYSSSAQSIGTGVVKVWDLVKGTWKE